jgi:hypothetical protein
MSHGDSGDNGTQATETSTNLAKPTKELTEFSIDTGCDDQTGLGMVCMLLIWFIVEKDNEGRNKQREECAGNRRSGRQKVRG